MNYLFGDWGVERDDAAAADCFAEASSGGYPPAHYEYGGGSVGCMVAVLDTQRYSERYPAEERSYLKSGALLEAAPFGLVHCTESDHDFTLVARDEGS